jgi:hypothetical protein
MTKRLNDAVRARRSRSTFLAPFSNKGLGGCVFAAASQFPKLCREILPRGLDLIDQGLAQNLTMLGFH